MYKRIARSKTSLRVRNVQEGETIETKIERIVNNGEAITDGAPKVFTERKDGVLPQYDIRTDRFEIAVEAMGSVDKTYKAKRQERYEERKKLVEDTVKKQGNNGEAEPIQGQD